MQINRFIIASALMCLTLSVPMQVKAKEQPENKEYTVLAKSGLRVRTKPNTGTVITVLPYNTTVNVLSTTEEEDSVWGETENGYICITKNDETYLRETLEITTEEISKDVPECIPSEARDKIIENRLSKLEEDEDLIEETEDKEDKIDTDDDADNEEIDDDITENETVIEEDEKIAYQATYEDLFNDNIYLLAQIMDHEARYEGREGLIAVAEVVRNRVKSDMFPNTIREVIYQEGQFTDSDELEFVKPKEETLQLAKYILIGGEGVLNNKDILFFRNAEGSTDDWGRYKYELTINHHQFYSYTR